MLGSRKKDMLNKEKYFERFLVLFDAVVAIIITIIVLTIHIPENATRVDATFLMDIGTTIAFYGISFYIVATFWEMHHRIVESIVGSTRKFIGYNFGLLFILSLFPIACIFMNDASTKHVEGLRQFAFVFYMVVNSLASIMQVRIMYYIRKHTDEMIFDEEMLLQHDEEHINRYYRHAKSKMYLNFFPILIAFFFPSFAFVSYIIVALLVMQSLKWANRE